MGVILINIYEMIGIYKITNTITGKIYIGSSINIERRFQRHKNDLLKNKHNNAHLQREYNNYTLDCFTFEVIEITCKSDLKVIEQNYLNKIFETDNYNKKYYNVSKNSSGGDNLTQNPNREKIIEKIKIGTIERFKNETEIEKKIRIESKQGQNNPNYGNKWSVEKRKRMSNHRKGLESKLKGKTHVEIHGPYKSIELKNKHSEHMKGLLIGDRNGFYGKKHTEENLKFFSESQKGKPTKGLLSRLRPFSIDDKVYFTLNQASKDLDIHYLTIRYRLKSKKFENYIYIEDESIINKLKEDYINQESI
jgi:group I intron endonuclease